MAGVRRNPTAWLFEPVDNSALVLFRIIFGVLLFLESSGSIVTGWVMQAFIEPRVHFPMIGFDWLQPLPGPGMYLFYAVMAATALLVAAGAYFRMALAAFTAMWTATYLMQTVSYNNHYYLLILLCLLLLPTPAHADVSVDARRRPALRSSTCPRWCVAVFQVQIAIVYFYAAVAKLDSDWLAGRPIGVWLADRVDDPLVGPLFRQPWLTWVLAYGGLLFDGLIVPLLLWKRTRLAAVLLAVVFHLFNSYTFRIGIFPYLGIAFCLFFFPGEALRRHFLKRLPLYPSPKPAAPAPLSPRQRSTLAVLAVYFVVQIALPLRHWLYPGNVTWTEEGHRMAWRMMLRSKTGSVVFIATDPDSGRTWEVDPSEHLTEKQLGRVATRPDLLWQFAHYLARLYADQGMPHVEIRARTEVSLNGRPSQPLVDPAVDLAHAEWRMLRHNEWITAWRE